MTQYTSPSRLAGGFVLIHRDLIGHPQFRGKDDEYAAIWLIVQAAWQPGVRRIAGQAVRLERGQCCLPLAGLAQAWECAKSTALGRLRHFVATGFIRTEVRSGLTLITLCKYDDYQAVPTEARPTSDRAPTAGRPSLKRLKQGNTENERTPPPTRGAGYDPDASRLRTLAAFPDLAG